MEREQCPRCSHVKLWIIRRQRRRCARCRYDWRPGPPLGLSRHQWETLLRGFLQSVGIRQLARKLGFNHQRVLRALTLVRMRMADAVPGFLKMDIRFLNRTSKNGAGEPPKMGDSICGVLGRNGHVWAHMTRPAEARALAAKIQQQARTGAIICSDFWDPLSQTGGATKHVISNGRGLVGFWDYLKKRRIPWNHRILREKASIYLAEYVWRYNHRSLSIKQRIPRLMKLIAQRPSLQNSREAKGLLQ